jgi:hypothetical protein
LSFSSSYPCSWSPVPKYWFVSLNLDHCPWTLVIYPWLVPSLILDNLSLKLSMILGPVSFRHPGPWSLLSFILSFFLDPWSLIPDAWFCILVGQILVLWTCFCVQGEGGNTNKSAAAPIDDLSDEFEKIIRHGLSTHIL